MVRDIVKLYDGLFETVEDVEKVERAIEETLVSTHRRMIELIMKNGGNMVYIDEFSDTYLFRSYLLAVREDLVKVKASLIEGN